MAADCAITPEFATAYRDMMLRRPSQRNEDDIEGSRSRSRELP